MRIEEPCAKMEVGAICELLSLRYASKGANGGENALSHVFEI